MEKKLRSTQALIREKKIRKFHTPQESIENRIENQDCPKDKGKNRRFIKRNQWKKIQDKKKTTPITPIYNYSKIELSESMTKVLSRGLNFCINPKKFKTTEMLVDYRKFERKLKWKEFFCR
jgi:hypothetical protein